MSGLRTLGTRRGVVPFPAYIPVTTFGTRYPLDGLIRPYLPRLSPAVMVSYHYAQPLQEEVYTLGLPIFMDSGGFAALFQGARLVSTGGAVNLEYPDREGVEQSLSPGAVLAFQEQHADVAFSLDFPIPMGMAEAESEARHRASILNARWAIENRRSRTMKLFASLQGWDPDSYGAAATELAALPFDGFAIGGLVPRAKDEDLVLGIVRAVRAAVGEDRPIHAFGMGRPEMVTKLFQAGVASVDSSSYVKAAADGISWFGRPPLQDPSPLERMRLALENLSAATGKAMPLAAFRR